MQSLFVLNNTFEQQLFFYSTVIICRCGSMCQQQIISTNVNTDIYETWQSTYNLTTGVGAKSAIGRSLLSITVQADKWQGGAKERRRYRHLIHDTQRPGSDIDIWAEPDKAADVHVRYLTLTSCNRRPLSSAAGSAFTPFAVQLCWAVPDTPEPLAHLLTDL